LPAVIKPEVMKPEIIKIEVCHPDQALIARAAIILKEGGVIAYPTETFYGLGAQAGTAAAVERIFTIKGRSFGNPIPLIIGIEENLAELVQEVSPIANKLMEAFWPGPLTLVFHASARIIPRLTAGTGKIGIRVSSHPIAAALAKTLAFPITATSANLSGAGECSTAQEVIDCLGEKIDALIDGGRTRGGVGSTILDMTTDPPAMLREGVIPGTLIYSKIGYSEHFSA
jgi:L-threonylcarbamoyladenylate synthase